MKTGQSGSQLHTNDPSLCQLVIIEFDFPGCNCEDSVVLALHKAHLDNQGELKCNVLRIERFCHMG